MTYRLIDSILGCIVGGAIGDAAGAAFEGQGNTPFENWRNADWYLTDDTQLTLATCEAIVEAGRPDPEAVAATFLRWFKARRLSCLGASTWKALRDLEAGAHWALSGRKGERAAGNGAAMRIAPLAFCLDQNEDESHQTIRDICRITHHNDESWVGALALIQAIRGSPHLEISLEKIALSLPQTSVRDRLLDYAKLPAETDLLQAAQRFGASGYVVDSVPLALFGASKCSRIGFERMIGEIIAAGGDTDTNASIAGQVAGSRARIENLPGDLVSKLPQRNMVLRIAESFAEFVAKNRP